MTEKELELTAWLNRGFYADKKIKVLEQCVRQSRERAAGLAGCCTSNDTGRSSGRKNSTEFALQRLCEQEERFRTQTAALLSINAEILDAISKLDDNDLEAVLIHRYVLYHTIEQTAEIMNYSPRTVRYKQQQAIKKLCLILPCFASSDVL